MPTPKSEVTRRHILDKAVALFRRRGFAEVTMRDVAKAAGVALGAAYYYFPSKEALVFAYYAETQTTMEARAAQYPPGEPLRARLGRLMHDKLDAAAPDRKMLASIVGRLANPRDPVSAFSTESGDIRARSIALFEQALAPEDLPDATRRIACEALWLFHLGVLYFFLEDASPGQKRSRRLVDDLLDLGTPLVAAARTPAAAALLGGLAAALTRAGIRI
jgi:AcrR family transcriptional regulator